MFRRNLSIKIYIELHKNNSASTLIFLCQINQVKLKLNLNRRFSLYIYSEHTSWNQYKFDWVTALSTNHSVKLSTIKFNSSPCLHFYLYHGPCHFRNLAPCLTCVQLVFINLSLPVWIFSLSKQTRTIWQLPWNANLWYSSEYIHLITPQKSTL